MISRRLTLFLALFVGLVAPARATWSIVIVDRRTGEVGVASATCLADFPLRRFTPVVVVGVGGAAAQSQIDSAAENRIRIWNGLHAGLSPQEILDDLAQNGTQHQSRQYGIVGVTGPAATFTGANAGQARFGVTGSVGDWDYAIQGNVITGAEVVLAAEAALHFTDGDLGERLMASMQAARRMGGDGRCSCLTGSPDSCGSPPPPFTHSAYTGYVIVARHGDTDGTCGNPNGCATGSYYLRKSFNGNASDPDPVEVLQTRYDNWRLGLQGVTDHFLSEVHASLPVLQADGRTVSTIDVVLRDLEGGLVGVGGQTLQVRRAGDDVATPGVVIDNGDGTHTFELVASTTEGIGEFTITVQDGARAVRLWPSLAVRSVAPLELHVGQPLLSAAEGTPVPLVLTRPAVDVGRPYRVLASFTGTNPGTDVGGTLVPLTRDRLFDATLRLAGGPPFTGSVGALDFEGRGYATLDPDPGTFAGITGSTIWFCALLGGGPGEVTNVGSTLVGP